MAKKLFSSKYSFDPANNLVYLDGNILYKRLLLITNLKTGEIIYNFADPNAGANQVSYIASLDKTAIQLKYTTSSMSSTDDLQIFIEQEETEFTAAQSLLDPVSKLRVSTPGNLIDTDFEYGLQSTRWETAKIVNNIPTFYTKNANVPVTVASVAVTSGQKLVTVTTLPAHGLIPGAPFEIAGLSVNRFEGSYLVKSVDSTGFQFTYEAAISASTTGNVATAFTTVNPGAFYTGSNVTVDSITTDGASPLSNLTFTTTYPHGFKKGNQFYVLNTVAFSQTSFNAADTAVVNINDTISVTQTISSTTNGSDTATYQAKAVVITDWISSNIVYVPSTSILYSDITTTTNAAASTGATTISVTNKTGLRSGQIVSATNIGPNNTNVIVSVSTSNNNVTLKYGVIANIISGLTLTFKDDTAAVSNTISTDSLSFGHLYNQNGNTLPGGLTNNTTYIIHAIDNTHIRFYLEGTTRQTVLANYKTVATTTGTATNTLNLDDSANNGNSFNLTSNNFSANDGVVYDVSDTFFTTTTTAATNGYVNTTALPVPAGNTTTNQTIQFTSHGFQTGQYVLYKSTATAIGGLTSGNYYYLQNAATNNIRLWSNAVVVTTSTVNTQNGYVNTTNRTIRWDGHGFTSGDLVCYNVLKSGATPAGGSYTGIGAVSANSDQMYYVDVVDANTFKLNTSNTLAAGSTVLISGAGTTGQPIHIFLKTPVTLTSSGSTTASAHSFKASASINLQPEKVYWIRDVGNNSAGISRYRLTATPGGTAIPLHFTGKSPATHIFTRGLDLYQNRILQSSHGFVQDDVVVLDTNTLNQVNYYGQRSLYGKAYFVDYIDANTFKLRSNLLSTTPVTLGNTYSTTITTNDGLVFTKAAYVDLTSVGSTTYGPSHLLLDLQRLQFTKSTTADATYGQYTLNTYNNTTLGLVNTDPFVVLGPGTSSTGLNKSSNNYNSSNYNIYAVTGLTNGYQFKANGINFTTDSGGYSNPLYVVKLSNGPSGVANNANSIYISNHGFVNNQYVQYTNTGTSPSAISPLVANTYYYVVNASTSNFQLASTSGGSAIDLTSFGSGDHNFISTTTDPNRDTILLPTTLAPNILTYSPGSGTPIQRQTSGASSGNSNLASTTYKLLSKGVSGSNTKFRLTDVYDQFTLSSITYTAGASTFTAVMTGTVAGSTPANLVNYDWVDFTNITGGNSASNSWFTDSFSIANGGIGSVTTNASGLSQATVTFSVPAYKDKGANLSATSGSASKFINLTVVGTGTQTFNNLSDIDGVYSISDSPTSSSTTFNCACSSTISSISKTVSSSTDINITTDAITISNHRFTDGTVVTYTPGTGATVPTGLTSGQNYYVIVVNKDTIKLASSLINAIGTNPATGIGKRTAIDISTAGTGNQLFTTSSIFGEVPSNLTKSSSGTVTLASGDLFVSGSATKFLTLFSPGEKLRVYTASKLYEFEIDSIKSDTRLKLKSNIPNNYGDQGDTTPVAVSFTAAPFAVTSKVYPKTDAASVHRPFDGGVDMQAGIQPKSRISRQTKKYFRYQSGKGIQCSLSLNFTPSYDIDSLKWIDADSSIQVYTKRPHNFSSTNFSNIQLKVAGADVASGYNPYNGTYSIYSIIDEFNFKYKPVAYTFTGNLTANSNVITNVNPDAFNQIQIGGLLTSTNLPLQTLGNTTVAGTIVTNYDSIGGTITLGSSVNRPVSNISSTTTINMPAATGNPFANGNIVQFNRSVSNILSNIGYYVVNSGTSGYNIANISGGSAITLTNLNFETTVNVSSISSNTINVPTGQNVFANGDWISFNNTTSNIVQGNTYIVKNATTSSYSLSTGGITGITTTGGGTFASSANTTYTGIAATLSQAFITGATWSGGNVTLTYSGSYVFPSGSTIVVQKVTPNAYNGVYTVVSNNANANTVTFALASNPGTYTSGGVVSNPSNGTNAQFTITRDSTGAIPATVTKTGTTGNSGETVLTVTSNIGIVIGMGVSGTNIPFGTLVTDIQSNIVYISNALTGAVNGSVTFRGVSINSAGQYFAVGDVLTIDSLLIGGDSTNDLGIVVSSIDDFVLADLASGSVPSGFSASPVPLIVSPAFNASATQTNASISVAKSPASKTALGFPRFNVSRYTDAGIRAGMFDSQNGFFFEFDGTNLNCVRRSATQQVAGLCSATKKSRILSGVGTTFSTQLSEGDSIIIRGQTYNVIKIVNDTTLYFQPEYKGTTLDNITVTRVIDTKVPQTQWNIDPCDGTGKHAYILDTGKIQMVYMDYSWYGAGKIRFGFKDQHGEVKYVHEFIHNNILTESYFRSGNLPARYECYTKDSPDFSPSLFHWGTSIIMDGRFDDDKAYLFTGDSKFLSFTNGGSNTITAGSGVSITDVGTLPSGVSRVIEVPTSAQSSIINGAPISGTNLTTGTVIQSSYRSGNNIRIVTYPAPTANSPSGTPSFTIGDTSTLIYNLTSVTSGNGIPLVSVRLAPSVDNGLTGPVGYRDIINRMQMNSSSVGIITTHDLECKLVLNGILSNDDFKGLAPPSLAQYYQHSVGDTVTGGDVIFSFRAAGGDYTTKKTASTTIDLTDLTTLGNSILGGDGVFPNGPDVLTLTINPVEPSQISGSTPLNVSARISWKESQA